MATSFFRLVDVHVHGDAKVRALTPEPPSGRGLFKHLLICPELGPLPGVIRAGAAALAEALDWPLEALLDRFAELLREGLVQVDWKASLIFLTNGIRYNHPNNPSQVLGWARYWRSLPDSPLKATIWKRYLAHFTADADRRRKEIRAGLRDKKQDPEALLKAFLENIPEPEDAASRPRDPLEEPAPAAVIPPPQPPPPGPRWTAPPIPGEDLLAALADDLQTAHPRGLAGGTDLQHALLHALKTGELRPDGTAARKNVQSITVSELRQRHAAWCAAWAAGASLPMNLANWIGKRRCWSEEPPEPRAGTGGASASPDEAARRRERYYAQGGAAEFLHEAVRIEEESANTLEWD